MQSISIQVFGKVQGVWFRKSTQLKAEELGIVGTVQNLTDGSVFIEATGNEKPIQDFKNWCSEGPPHARVESLEVKEIPIKTFKNFTIIR